MAGKNLFEEFHADEVEEMELEAIFSGHFGGSMSLSLDEVAYPGHKTQHALKLRYGKKGLSEITAGPMLDAETVKTLKAQIESELLASSELRVAREILFAGVPVEGYFRYRDLFQILPVPPEAPRPQFIGAEHHPFMLEFRFPASSNSSVCLLRRALRGRELELLAAGLLEFLRRVPGRTARRHWVLPKENLAPGEKWRSAYLQEMYTWPGRPGESGDFTVIEKISRLSEIDPQEYCTRLGISSDRRFEIPSNLTDLLDRYFALSEQDQEQFLRACFWFVHAREVYSESRSATFTALISAIETLMPSAKGDDICPECKQPRRVTQRFSDFVESLASTGSVLEADRKRFYGIRSKLSHGGFLLHSDRFTWAPGLTGGKLREWEDVGTIWQLVRIVLVNWLQAQKTGT